MSFSGLGKELGIFSKLESRWGHLGHITDKGGTLGIWDLGSIWEASETHLGSIWGASGKHLGDIWEASRHLGSGKHLGDIWEASLDI